VGVRRRRRRPAGAEGTYLLEDEAGGTRCVWRVDAASGFGGRFRRVSDAAIVAMASENVRADRESLPAILAEQPEHDVVPDAPRTA
jgi:hypothetical protein